MALQDCDEQGDRSGATHTPARTARGPAPCRAGTRRCDAVGPRDRGPRASDGTARRVRPAQSRGTHVRGGRGRARMQRRGGAVARRGGYEESEGGRAMNALEPLVGEARERLVARAKREGLVRVGYDVMDSPLGPLWIAVGPRGG